ncbi:MAG: hypothetical protein GWO24_01805, partial [Akkermansiaceae bacterium]|nr:hypothetical protein [Akkermansiaceae bacterium]
MLGTVLAASTVLSPAQTLRVERLEGDTLSLAIDDLPAGQAYHLRRSQDGEAFESLSPPLDITGATPQPIAVPVDHSAEPTVFFQLFEGASPRPFME